MTDYTFTVAMDVRAYGTVDAEAPTLEEALSKITTEYLTENFEGSGGGSDDFDMTPLDASISGANWVPEYDGDGELDLNYQIPNDIFRMDIAKENEPELALKALRFLYLADPSDGLAVLINDLEKQFKHIKGEVPA